MAEPRYGNDVVEVNNYNMEPLNHQKAETDFMAFLSPNVVVTDFTFVLFCKLFIILLRGK